MSGLSEADHDVLARIIETTIGLGAPDSPGCRLCGRDIPCPTHTAESAVFNIAPTVEAIVTRAVVTALNEAADAIAEFDPSDKYHAEDYQEPGYYRALSRAESLLRGEIRTWHDSPPSPRTT